MPHPPRCFRADPRRLCTAAVLLLSLLAAGLARAADDAAPATAPAPAPAAVPTTGVENSVVKIFSTMRYPDPFRPWAKQAPREASGSGVVLLSLIHI